MTTFKRSLVWAWCWLAWWIIRLLPYQFTATRLGLSLLPWAGVYAYTEGGRAEFMANGLQRSRLDHVFAQSKAAAESETGES